MAKNKKNKTQSLPEAPVAVEAKLVDVKPEINKQQAKQDKFISTLKKENAEFSTVVKEQTNVIEILTEDNTQLQEIAKKVSYENLGLQAELELIKEYLRDFLAVWKSKKNFLSRVAASYTLVKRVVKWANSILNENVQD
jgi:hypothetical protein